MYNFSSITLGVVSTRRDRFPSVENALKNNEKLMVRIHEILDKLPGVKVVYAEKVLPGGLICEPEETNTALTYFREQKIDALLMLHANFGQEEAVGRLCKALNVPVLIWGPRDGEKNSDVGFRSCDTQCGMFASTRALLRWGVKFTYAENCWLDSPILEREIDKFLRAASVVKAFRNMHILQLSSRPRQFLSVKVNESEMMEKFGFQLTTVETTLLEEAFRKVCAERKEEVERNVRQYEEQFDLSAMDPDKRFNMAAFVLTILELVEKYDCTTVACECWNVPQAITGIQGCMAFGILEDMGITVSCECDINGCVTAALARAAARGDSPVFFADVTVRHPFNDNAELMWHCGRYPASLSRCARPRASQYGQMLHELKPGDITMMRFDGTRGKYYLFADEGRGVDGPTTQGAYVWFEADNWVKWEKKLMYGPYIHHMAGVYGKYRDAVEEACRYLNVEFDCADRIVEYE